MKPVIALGGDIIALWVARALSQNNIDVILMRYSQDDMAQASKHVIKSILSPNPNHNEEAYINALIQQSKFFKGALLIPTNDDTLVAIAKHKEELSNYYIVSVPDWEITRIFIEKENTYALCEELNIPCPKTCTPKTVEELEQIKNNILYPCIIKPCISHRFVAEFNTKLFKIYNPDELRKKFALCLKKNHKVMIQEYVEGEDSNTYGIYMYYNTKGKLETTFTIQKIRQNPPRVGVSRVTKHIPPIIVIEQYAKQLLENIKFRGMAVPTFKYDPRDRIFKLIEVNIRFVRPHALPIQCGINYPLIMYNDIVNGTTTSYKKKDLNTYWIDLFAEFFNFTKLRDSKEKWTIKDYIRPYRGKKVFAVYDSSDIKPFLRMLLRWMLFNLPLKYFRILSASAKKA